MLAWGHLRKQLHQDMLVPLMSTDEERGGRHRFGVRLGFGNSAWWQDGFPSMSAFCFSKRVFVLANHIFLHVSGRRKGVK